MMGIREIAGSVYIDNKRFSHQEIPPALNGAILIAKANSEKKESVVVSGASAPGKFNAAVIAAEGKSKEMSQGRRKT